MSNVLKMSRKALTATVVGATIAWSIGLSALLAPLAVQAAVTSGSLIKGSLSAVYYVGSDGKRYVFPNEKTYKTWYSDFSTVMTVTDAELASMPIGGNVTYRPGVKLVKIQTDPKTYAVGKNGMLRWVTSEAIAVCLYGSDWNTADTQDLSDAFFVNYTIGADITSCSGFNPAAETAGSTSINMDKGLSTSSTSGSFTAMLSASQPAGGSVAGGATGVAMVKVDVRNNGSTTMTVDSLTAHRVGNGLTTDIANLYVYEGNNRLTTGRTVNSSSNEATFSGLNLSLGAGAMKTLWIAADFNNVATSGGNQHRIEVTHILSGTLDASGLPLSGPTYTMSSSTVGSVSISKSGTLSNPKAGQLQAKVGEFQLAAGSAEDIRLSRVSLFYAGSASRSNLTNLTLKQAGLTLATVASISDKDLVVFALSSPMFIEKGNTRTFQVYADISGATRAADTTKLYLDQNTDLQATGATFGYGVAVTNINYDGSPCISTAGDCSFATIDAGQLTVTFNGPAGKNVPSNGKDQELYNFTMAAQSNLEIRKLTIRVDGSGSVGGALGTASTTYFTDVKVTDTATGTTVSGPKDLPVGVAATQTLAYTEVFNLNAGQSRTFKVTADVASTAPDGLIAKVTLVAFGGSDIRNLDNSTFLGAADIVPNADISGNNMTIKTPSLVMSSSSTPVSQTYIQGTQGAQLLGISLKAGDASDVKVTSLKVTGYADANDGSVDFVQGQDTDTTTAIVANDVLTLKLWNGSTQLGQTKSPGAGADGTATFDSLNLTVPAGQTVTLTLSGNLASSIANLPDRVKFDVAANGDISATDPDGNSLAATGATFNGTTADSGIRLTLKAAGAVAVNRAPDDSESEASLVVGGSANTVLAKFTLSASDEELKLTKARMTVTAPTTVSSLSLYDGSTLVGGPTSPDGSGNADFSNVNFVIPKDGSKTLSVKATLNTVGPSGATTGLNAKITFSDTTNFEVRGTSSGSNTLLTTYASGPKAGNDKVIRKTKPTISLVALPSTQLAAGQNVVLRFTVTADAGERVSLKALKVLLQNSTAAQTLTLPGGSQSSIRRVGDASALTGTSALTACTTGVACTLTAMFATEEVIAAGTSRTYDILVTSSGSAANDAVTAKLLGDTALASSTGSLTDGTTAGSSVKIATVDANFAWSDNSAALHDATVGASSADWASGYLVKVLPTDTQTISK